MQTNNKTQFDPRAPSVEHGRQTLGVAGLVDDGRDLPLDGERLAALDARQLLPPLVDDGALGGLPALEGAVDERLGTAMM